MQEVFPFVAGCLIGLAVLRIRAPKLRAAALAVLCVLFGVLASYISGELAVSWGFLSADMALVWVGAFSTSAVAALWRRRAAA